MAASDLTTEGHQGRSDANWLTQRQSQNKQSGFVGWCVGPRSQPALADAAEAAKSSVSAFGVEPSMVRYGRVFSDGLQGPERAELFLSPD